MTRDEFVNLFKSRVDQIIEIVELAAGVLAARNSNGERFICFDKSLCRLDDELFSDLMAEDTWIGLIEEIKSNDWDRVIGTAFTGLRTLDYKEITCHKKPVNVQG